MQGKLNFLSNSVVHLDMCYVYFTCLHHKTTPKNTNVKNNVVCDKTEIFYLRFFFHFNSCVPNYFVKKLKDKNID